MTHKIYKKIFYVVLTILIVACSASNCPLESTVTCNYGFYDSEGNPVVYNDTITISTLLDGHKNIFIYRKLGYPTVSLDHQDSSYINNGYSEYKSTVRKDTILINKLSGAHSMKLPMSYFSSTDTLVVTYASISNKDTIYISHDSFSYVDLPECGTHRFHSLKDIKSTESGIFSISIVNPHVNYDGNENVKIYFNGTAY